MAARSTPAPKKFTIDQIIEAMNEAGLIDDDETLVKEVVLRLDPSSDLTKRVVLTITCDLTLAGVLALKNDSEFKDQIERVLAGDYCDDISDGTWIQDVVVDSIK